MAVEFAFYDFEKLPVQPLDKMDGLQVNCLHSHNSALNLSFRYGKYSI